MKTVYIAIGSNVGDIEANINSAISMLRETLSNIKISSWYKTEPFGVTDQDYFVNLVVSGQTDMEPEGLLERLKGIEEKLGRQKRERWGPREIDLDIVLYGDRIVYTEDLQIPHVGLNERDFVLVPLLELDPDLIHPTINKPLASYLENLETKTILGKI